jgi:hypothetical protein
VDAVARFSQQSAIDPIETLESSFDALRSLIAGQILIPGSEATDNSPKGQFVPGMEIAGCEVARVLQSLDDCAVYEAISRDRRSVAIKVVPSSAPEIAHTMLSHEAKALRLLHGSCTPALLAQGESEGDRYLILEWLAGRDVAAEAARLRVAGVRQRHALHKLCLRVLRCYADLHKAGVIHGDVHPGNVVVSPSGSVRLLDFGRCFSARTGSTVIPRAGVAQYYEPELAAALAAGKLPPIATQAGEQYAVAALLYELLTGRSYADFSMEKDVLLRQVMQCQPMPFTLAGVQPWPAVESVLRRALAKNPTERFASMADFAIRFAAAEMPPAQKCHPPSALVGDMQQRTFLSNVEAAWFLMRAALIREDAALLAKADVLAESTAVHYVRARVAHARCDSFSRALHHFSRSIESEPGLSDVPAICWFLSQGISAPELRRTAEEFQRTVQPDNAGSREALAWLQLTQVLGNVAQDEVVSRLRNLAEQERNWSAATPPPDVAQRLRFWALANQLTFDDTCRRAGEHVALACLDHHDSDLPFRSFALLEWFRCTGDPKWMARTRLLAKLPVSLPGNGSSSWSRAQLELELEKPEIFEFPCWL